MSKFHLKKKALTLSLMGGLLVGLSSCNKPLDPIPSNKQSTVSNISYDESTLPNAPASFINRTFTYSGSTCSIAISDYSENENSNVNVTYSLVDEQGNKFDGNGRINVGTYTVTASFLSKKTNLKVYKDLTATLIIVPANYANTSSILIENDGIYSYKEDTTYSVKVIDPVILSLFDVTYEEINQNKKDVGTYQVKTTFTSKDGNYNTFTTSLFYSIIEEKNDHTVTIINPYQDSDNVIVLDKIPSGLSLNKYLQLEENKEKKEQIDKIVSRQNNIMPYATFSWSYNFDLTVADTNAILIATPKNVNINFKFPDNSGIYIRKGNTTYMPYNIVYETKQITVSGTNIDISYAKLNPSTIMYDLLDIDFEMNGHILSGFYLDSEYKNELYTTKLTSNMFNPQESALVHFDLMVSDSVTIFVKII